MSRFLNLSYVGKKPAILGLIALVICYLPVITTNNPVNPDAQFILPNLRATEGVIDYLSKLINLETIDVQPVRDASLSLDLMLYQLTGWNSIILHNLILWIFSGIVTVTIFERIFPDLTKEDSRFILVAFLLYPLYSQTLCWGMARKHILAFLFTMLATDRWLSGRKGTTLFYSLAILSQPIALLWPCWAIVEKPKRYIQIIPAFFMLIIVGLANYKYYESSVVFAKLFGMKTNELANFPEMLLATGHYFFQIVFPFFLSSKYQLGHWTQLMGIFLLVVFGFFLYRSTQMAKFILSWSLFSFLPLSIVLMKPSFLYDTYLLIPSVGVFILCLTINQKYLQKIPRLTGTLLLLAMGAVTFYDTTFWRDEVILTKQSFDRRPDCASALLYLRISYENGQRPDSPSARKFMYEHKCDNMRTSPGHMDSLKASLLYYESDLTLRDRLDHLRRLSIRGIYPQIAYTGLLIKSGHPEDAKREIETMITRWENVRFREELIPIAKTELIPFCQKNQNTRCLELLKPFLYKTGPMDFH